MRRLPRAAWSRVSPPRIAPDRCAPCPCPIGIDYDTLHDRLKEEGYIIYAGLGDAAKNHLPRLRPRRSHR